MRKLSLVALVLLLLMAACTPTPVPPTNTPTLQPPTDTAAAPTDTAEAPTDTPEVTSTLSPTDESTTATPTADGSTSFIPFDQFLQSVRDARFEDYATLPGAQVKDEAAFEEMRKHILDLYDGVKQTSTFVSDGQYFDCVTIDSQPSVHQTGFEKVNMSPPESGVSDKLDNRGQPPGDFKYIESPLTLGLKDSFGNAISCDDGSIPLQRITLEMLTSYETLSDFFAKPGGNDFPRGDNNQPPADESADHRYAVSRQLVKNFGGNSWLNLWNPDLKSNTFSLSQQWYVAGDGDNTQTLEGGWQRWKAGHSKSDSAVLFIYRTNKNYAKDSGCYDITCKGFVQISKNWFLGGGWKNYSSNGQTQWGFEMQWKLYQGNWWLFLKGGGNYEAVGYYPTSIYNNGAMSKNATEMSFGGEVCCKSDFPEMGSGQFSNQGWQKAAYQNTIFSIPRDENGGTGVWATLFEIEPSPKCYTIDITDAAHGGNWGAYIFFGGPGGKTCKD